MFMHLIQPRAELKPLVSCFSVDASTSFFIANVIKSKLKFSNMFFSCIELFALFLLQFKRNKFIEYEINDTIFARFEVIRTYCT